ncbi:hypothetical protein [Roseomonas indoligenes]|uniref:Uncharacterized protein n=1 Tax=Roseomonas indoligenes TaxID=2820811 RepID=A0A940S7F7_9PROT|nr:hypothetical protein [Pararoseomonas indoligenes]MBP0493032.1 hypothetical protein [Pararoseomonas indoligenes]
MAINLAGTSAGIDFSGAPRVALPDSLPAPVGVFYLGGDAEKSCLNRASLKAAPGAVVGTPTFAQNYATLTGNQVAAINTLLAELDAITIAVVGRAKSSDVTPTSNRPVFAGTFGSDPTQNIASAFGLMFGTNGVPSGQAAPHASAGMLSYSVTGNTTPPTPASNGWPTPDVPDLTTWRLLIASRTPGVEVRTWDKTANTSAAVSLVGKTSLLNLTRRILLGSDYGGTRLGSCEEAAVFIFPASFTTAMTDTLAAFSRAAIGARGVSGF